MEPIKKIRLSDRVIEAVKQMITENDFKPGDKFYSENELTKKLGVSRSSIREAIRILEATGYVTVKHGKGVFIADSIQHELDAFQEWLRTNEEAILDHFDVRLLIDPKAAAYSAKNADKNDIKKLEEACVDFESRMKDGNAGSLVKYDERFHELLAKSTKSRTLYFIMKSMTRSLPEGWISSLHVPGRIDKTVLEHKAILDAIKEGDAEQAEQAMLNHLNNAVEDIKHSMNSK